MDRTRIKVIVVMGDGMGEIKSWMITRHSIHEHSVPSAINDYLVPLR